MSNRLPYNPFEGLNDFTDLNSLIVHVLDSIQVQEIVVYLPDMFDTKLLSDPLVMFPVNYIVVGKAGFEHIRFRAQYVISSVKDRIEKVNQDSALSFTDKLKVLGDVNKWMQKEYKYFNTMNAIRYMTAYKWQIGYFEEIDGKIDQKRVDFPSSQIDLKEGDWNFIENNFRIRRDLISEVSYLIDEEVEKLEEELGKTKYSWAKEDWEYELHEILLALIASNRIDIVKGSEKTFTHDFLAFFGKPDKDFSYYKSKILDRRKQRGKYQTRGKRSIFLNSLQESLENYGLSSAEKGLL